MRKLDVVEICAGAGGQSLGLHLAGFEHRLAIELDATAAATLSLNLGRLHGEVGRSDRVAVGDVADESVWLPEDHSGVALLAGGVPCPPFSLAGKQLGANDERDLFAWAIEAAGRIKPDAILLENVRGLASSRFAGYRQAVLDRLGDLGYIGDWELLEARDYGVPQLRPRFVLVALRPEYAPYFEWPEKKPTTATVGSTLFDLMAANGWRGADMWADRANDIAPTIVGGSKKHGGADLGPSRARQAWLRLGVNGLGVADSAPSADAPIDLLPKLTCRMVERLQGWDGAEYQWKFVGRKTAHYRQIGNAFPPPVARAVGGSICRALRREGDPATLAPERRLHDDVYRALRDAASPLTLRQLERAVGGGLSSREIEDRLAHLSSDFNLIEVRRRGQSAWRLGEFRAFLGQADHPRVQRFAADRSRIS